VGRRPETPASPTVAQTRIASLAVDRTQVHIPAHGEQPFRFNVNTCSGGT
jgi:hypothetical protein